MSGVRDQRAKRQPAGRWYQCPGCWSGSFNRMTSDGYECECGERLFIIDLRDTEPSPFRPTTPAASDGSLDVAWTAAEAALPEGWTFEVHDLGPESPFRPGPDKEHGSHRYQAGAHIGIRSGGPRVWTEGPTPAAALTKLAARLSESASEGRTE